MKLVLKIKMSKKQKWEMSLLNKEFHWDYILSFVGSKGFASTYTNLTGRITSNQPFSSIRKDNDKQREDKYKHGIIGYLKWKMKHERDLIKWEFFRKTPINKLREIMNETQA